MDLMRRMRRAKPSQDDAASAARPAADTAGAAPTLTAATPADHPISTPVIDGAAPFPPELAAAAASPASSEHRVVGSAAIITAGSLLSSLLGMMRLEVINALFYGGAGGAFTVALRPIQQVSDLLVGGSVSGALIPTFVDYSAEERRAELRHVYCTVANLVAIIMTVACVGIVLTAPYFVPFETAGFTPANQRLTVQLVQIAALSLLGLGLYAVGAGLLYALKLVVYPAFATGIYHIAVMLCGTLVLFYALQRAGLPLSAALHADASNPAVELARRAGARGLAVGAAVGAAGEVLLLTPGIRKVIRVWSPVLDLRHPAVRQILRLYAPLLAGLAFAVAAQNLDVSLLARTPGGPEENSISFASSVTLIQFPVGLVSAALSFSALPVLAKASSENDTTGFKRTLVLGMRLGLLLMVPAMVGLLVLSTPIMALLFQHGTCGQGCTDRNVLAIRNMAYQLPFLAIDQMLIAAFYARKNTIIPTLVGVASIVCYAVVALGTYRTLGLPGMAFANAVQNSSHAIILFVLLTLAIGNLGMRGLADGALRIACAAVGMAAAGIATLLFLSHLNARIFTVSSTGGALLLLVLAGAVATTVYIVLAWLLRVPELMLLADIVRKRLGRTTA
jgi:putative peptidoglycan lipid II flippase